MIYGYARVSTDGQTLDAPLAALKAAGAEKVFRETASGAKTDRRQLARAIKTLGKADVLVVTRLDRLARSTRDLLNTFDTIAKAGARFRSLHDAWADTTTAHGRLMLVLGGLAEFERDLIRARTSDGRERAKARGVHMGRPLPSRGTSARTLCKRWPQAPRRKPILRAGSMSASARFQGSRGNASAVGVCFFVTSFHPRGRTPAFRASGARVGLRSLSAFVR